MVEEKLMAAIARERIADLMPLLRALTEDEKKALAPHVKKLAKEYTEFRQHGSSWTQKGTPVQIGMIYAIAFACLNRKDYQKIDGFAQILSNNLLDELLSWRCPDWFGDYVNDLTNRDWLPWNFRYGDAVAMEEKKYLTLSDELIARLIPQSIFEMRVAHKYAYLPQNLEKRKITLEKHIWLIFQFETPIHMSDRYLQFENANKDENLWLRTLQDLSTRKLLDRNRILRESLLATGRNFNKALAGWFVDLFESMEPTTADILAIQPEVLITLSSQYSRAVNAALQAIKSICEEKAFDVRSFIDHAPVLLSSETKSVVAGTVTVFEKIARKNSSFRGELAVMACHAFIHQDEQIQTKVSKFLLKYNDSPLLVDELAKYAGSMLMTTKNLLSSLIVSDEAPVQSMVETNVSQAPGAYTVAPVNEISSVDELVFLSSQAFDNNDPLHFDLLPAALISLQEQLTGPVLPKFEAALQRAYNTVLGDWRSTMGYLDHMLATFFLEVTWVLIERFPGGGASLKKIHDNVKRKEEENKEKWPNYASRIPQLYTWSVQSMDNTYLIQKTILVLAHQRIKAQSRLPLLSTPTHEHGYVDPLILVKRLGEFQSCNELPDNYDFQLAISRVASFHQEQALDEAKRTLKGEILHIIQFLLNRNARPMPPFSSESAWFIAGVTKSPGITYPEFNNFFYTNVSSIVFTGDATWTSLSEAISVKKYDYQANRYVDAPSQNAVLRLSLPPLPTIWQVPEKPKVKSVLSKITNLLAGEKKPVRTQPYVLYEMLSLKSQWISAEHNDIQRIIGLFPSNPNPMLMFIAAKCLEHSTLASEMDKRMLTKALECLVGLKFHWSEITHVFVASCMLASDKTVRSFAAELWINAVVSGNVESDRVGKIIGTLFLGEYAPMKRFTDVVSDNLNKISAVHNSALESMLTGVIGHLPSQPPVGTKRLLELYSEILLVNGSIVTSPLALRKLSGWRTMSGLKKVLSTIALEV